MVSGTHFRLRTLLKLLRNMLSPTEDAVNRWKMQSFRITDLPYAVAVESLSGTHPMLEAKRTSSTEWVVSANALGTRDVILTKSQMCQAGTNTPAMLCYAGIFANADDYLSGNLVMGDNETPASLEESRV